MRNDQDQNLQSSQHFTEHSKLRHRTPGHYCFAYHQWVGACPKTRLTQFFWPNNHSIFDASCPTVGRYPLTFGSNYVRLMAVSVLLVPALNKATQMEVSSFSDPSNVHWQTLASHLLLPTKHVYLYLLDSHWH